MSRERELNLYSGRAPIQQESIQPAAPPDRRPKTRCGYIVGEAYQCYETALGQTGPEASGKALHFAADLVCSGGLEIWIRGAYTYAFQHIGLANPRIFVYLRQRLQELDRKAASLPLASFTSNPEVQSIIAEVVLVLQSCPKRAKIVWPKIDENAKRIGWIRGVASAPETRVSRLVWSPDSDSQTLYLVANELCKAIEEGASERALFWVRWVIEEDNLTRKETKGMGLSKKLRGPPSQSVKAQSEAGHFVAHVLLEVYKELAAKGSVRMNEEFQELLRLWRCGEQRMPARMRREALGWMTMICCEVPRWRVPAAPTLVADPVRLSRAVGQATHFFNEVLAHPPLPANHILKPAMMRVPKRPSTKPLTEKEKKELALQEKEDAFDAAWDAFLNR